MEYPSFLEDFFDEAWGRPGLMRANDNANVPAVNIKENDDTFEIQVAAPGMDEDDFEINVENNTLSISVEKEVTNQEGSEDTGYTRREFSYSSFKRNFNLPDIVDQDKIEGDYENGVLRITVPKKEEAKKKPARRIKVKNKNKELESEGFSQN